MAETADAIGSGGSPGANATKKGSVSAGAAPAPATAARQGQRFDSYNTTRFSYPRISDELDRLFPLERVVSEYVQLKRQGDELAGKCPLPGHDDSTPSFRVNASKNVFHCFGCGRGGHGAACFLSLMRGIPQEQMREELIARAGLRISRQSEAGALVRMSQLQARMARNLYEKVGQAALSYAAEKLRLSEAIIQHFGLGFSSIKDVPALESGHMGLERHEMGEAGLLDGAGGCLLKDHLTLPLRDAHGRVVSFIGWKPPGDASSRLPRAPQYITGKENRWFRKQESFFGLHESRGTIAQQRQALVAKDCADVLRLHQAGICNAVSAVGAAPNARHLEQLWAMADEVVLLLDGDKHGRAAAIYALRQAAAAMSDGKRMRICSLPRDMDADEFMRQRGEHALRQAIDTAPLLSSLMLNGLKHKYPLHTPQDHEMWMEYAEKTADSFVRAPRFGEQLRRQLGTHATIVGIASGLMNGLKSANLDDSFLLAQRSLNPAQTLEQTVLPLMHQAALTPGNLPDVRQADALVMLGARLRGMGKALQQALQQNELPAPKMQAASAAAPRAQPENQETQRHETPQSGPLKRMSRLQQRLARNLYEPAGQAALSYAAEDRGLNEDIIRRFGLGFATIKDLPFPKTKGNHAGANEDEPKWKKEAPGSELREIGEAGLLGHSGGFLLRDRLTLPIRDEHGEVVSFAGRKLPGDTSPFMSSAPKYINGRENQWFCKHEHLYGLYESKDSIVKQQQALVVEGYMDVISLHQAGICNAVAVMGTALSARHLERLWAMADEVVLLLDGDKAGQSAAAKALHQAAVSMTDGKRLRVCTLPGGLDPDEFIRAHGAPALHQAIDAAPALLDFLLDDLEYRNPLHEPEGRSAWMEKTEKLASRFVQAPLFGEQLRRLSAMRAMKGCISSGMACGLRHIGQDAAFALESKGLKPSGTLEQILAPLMHQAAILPARQPDASCAEAWLDMGTRLKETGRALKQPQKYQYQVPPLPEPMPAGRPHESWTPSRNDYEEALTYYPSDYLPDAREYAASSPAIPASLPGVPAAGNAAASGAAPVLEAALAPDSVSGTAHSHSSSTQAGNMPSAKQNGLKSGASTPSHAERQSGQSRMSIL